MNIASLRYPGGEEANTYEWAAPPYTLATTPQPVLTTTKGFPGGDWMFYNRFSRAFQSTVMDFDKFMGIAGALSNAEPYIVLNHDGLNVDDPLADSRWGYDQLKDAAVAWLQYIVRMNYTVSCSIARMLTPWLFDTCNGNLRGMASIPCVQDPHSILGWRLIILCWVTCF